MLSKKIFIFFSYFKKMGCIQSSPDVKPDDKITPEAPVKEIVKEEPKKEAAKPNIVPGVAPTTNHTVHSGVNVPQNKPVLVGLKRQISITLKSAQPNEEDILIVKRGNNYLIQNTNALVDINTGCIIGELKDDKVVLELNDNVKAMCKTYDMEFQKSN